jgi:glycosyl transferase family 25
MDIYCINLASRPDRWSWMQEQFSTLGLVAIRVEATTPSQLTTAQRDAYCNPARRRSLNEPLYCCGLSHRKVWQAIVDSGAPFALVLEDDAILSASLPRLLAAVDRERPEFSLVRLEVFQRKPLRFGRLEPWLLPDIGLRRSFSRDAGTAGYLISRQAALFLLDQPSFHTTQIDAFIFNPHSRVGRQLGVRYTDPALCIQLEIANANRPERATDISNTAGAHRQKQRRYAHQRIARQIVRWLTYDLSRLWSRLEQIWIGGVQQTTIAFRPD